MDTSRLEPEEKNAKSNNAEDENARTVVNLREGGGESYLDDYERYKTTSLFSLLGSQTMD